MAPMTRSSTLAQRVQITITDEGSDHSNSVSSLSSSELDAHGVNVDIEDDSAEESDEESEVESDQSKGAMPWSNDSTTAYLEQESGFHWDQLPGECRNKIYRYLMRSQRPLKLQHLGSLPSSSWGKPFQLSAQFLRCSASIYNEALPILLGENAFTLWNNLSEIIGKGATRRKREPLIRRLVIETTQVERVINKIRMKELGALKNLKKVEFESRSLGVTLKDMFRDDWEKTAREALGDLPHQLKDLMKLRPDVEYFYFDEGMVPAPPGKPGMAYVGFEWEVRRSGGELNQSDEEISHESETSPDKISPLRKSGLELVLAEQQEYLRQGDEERRVIQKL